MALIPKNFKFKKYSKSRVKLSIYKKKKNEFGQFSLKAVESGRLTSKQIEATRRFLKKKIKPFGGIVKTKLKLVLPVTSKPIAVRMGRGKGRVNLHICPVKSGEILFSIYCLNFEEVKKAAIGAKYKLPINIKFDIKKI
jgi:large subunit ribosomal protein L16